MRRLIFVIFVTIGFLSGCKSGKKQLQTVKPQTITISNDISSNNIIEDFVAPFRKHIEKELATVLAYNPTDLVKDQVTTELNTPISNFMAEVAYEQTAPIFLKLTGKKVDFCLLNWGGIRSGLAKGNITRRSAFNLMPFENRLVVAELTGKEILEMAQYLISEHIPNPISRQVEFHFDKNNNPISLKINSEEVKPDKNYCVCTTDYVVRGGDRMNFFKKATNVTDINYSFRNALIDYFIKIDTLRTKSDNRIKKFN